MTCTTASSHHKNHVIRFPKEDSTQLGQNEAFFFLDEGDGETRLRFHDYDAIYERPGLYEQLFYERLRCTSPEVVADRLERAMEQDGASLQTLRILDLGAGNGIMGDELKKRSVSRLVGLDIIEEAKDAALRDRPGVYDEYLVADMTDLPKEQHQALADWRFNGLTCVAALGFGDIPAAAFVNAMELVADDGWLAFNVKTDFLQGGEGDDFASFVKVLLDRDLVALHLIERYWHRLSIDGEWLRYFVLVARKRGPLPRDVLERFG